MIYYPSEKDSDVHIPQEIMLLAKKGYGLNVALSPDLNSNATAEYFGVRISDYLR